MLVLIVSYTPYPIPAAPTICILVGISIPFVNSFKVLPIEFIGLVLAFTFSIAVYVLPIIPDNSDLTFKMVSVALSLA